MKLAVSNIAWEAGDDAHIYSLMEELGFSGLEIAPTRIFPSAPYDDLPAARRWAQELMRTHGFTVPSMQSIWFGRGEHLFGSAQERAALLDYTRRAIDFAAAVGCGNLVFGCPKNRTLPGGADSGAAAEFFRELGDYAHQRGTVLAMEANPAIYGTNYINTTAEALALVKAVNSPGFMLNLDIGTMIENGEDVDVLAGNEAYINHVHVSEPFLKPIERRALHTRLAAFLRAANYRGYVSIEMGRQTGGTSALEAAMAYVRDAMG